MKAIMGLVLACGACCAVPFVAAGLIGAGTAGAALSFWQWELGAAVAALAAAGGIAVWYRRNWAGALCGIPKSSSKVEGGCCPAIATETDHRPGQ